MGNTPFLRDGCFPPPRKFTCQNKQIRNESKRIVASSNLLETNCLFYNGRFSRMHSNKFLFMCGFCTPELMELYIYSPSLTWFTSKRWWIFPSSRASPRKSPENTRQTAPMRSPPSEVIMEHIQVIFNTKAPGLSFQTPEVNGQDG